MATEYEESSIILLEEISQQNSLVADENRPLREELQRRDEANAKAMADLKTEINKNNESQKRTFRQGYGGPRTVVVPAHCRVS